MSLTRTLLIGLLLTAVTYAQPDFEVRVQAAEVGEPSVQFEIVEPNRLRVVVTDAGGRPVGDLTPQHFEVGTDLTTGSVFGVEPLIHTERAKVSIALCIDNSQSMRDHLTLLRQTLDTLVEGLGPSVKISTIFFADASIPRPPGEFMAPPNIQLYPFTRDKEYVRQTFHYHLTREALIRKTFLYDQVYTAIELMQGIEDPDERRFVVVLSDGEDFGSQRTDAEVRQRLGQNPGIVFYTIDFLQEQNPFMAGLAAQSGGRYYQAKEAEELAAIFEEISRDIVKLSGYLVTYDLPMAFLTGRVRAEGSCELVPEAAVEIYPQEHRQHRRTVFLDSTGVFTARAEFPYSWVCRVAAPGYLPDSASLVEQGLAADRIEAEGRGVSEKYDNSTDEGRALNRRTDVMFFDRKVISDKTSPN